MKGSFVIHSMASRVRALVAALVLLSLVTPAFCQDFLKGATAPMPSAVGAQLDMTPGSAGDVFLGKNTRGPYLLSWKQIDPESESMTIDGITSQKGIDYSIDYAAGTVAFDRPLRSGSIARIQYRYTVGKAVANVGALSLPVELSLMQDDSSSVRLIGLFKEAAPNQQSGATVVGLGGDHKWGDDSKISSTFLMSAGNDNHQDADFWDKTALRVGGSHGTDRLRLRTSYERSGEAFDGSKEYGMKEGMAATDVAASFMASDKMMIDSTFTRLEDIAGVGKGSSKTITEQKLAYALSPVSRLALSRRTDETVSDTGVQQGVDVERLDASHNFGSSTSATASVTNTTKSSAGDTIQSEMAARFNLQSSDKLQVLGSYVDSSVEGVGETSTTQLAVTAKPAATVNVNADYKTLSSDALGDQSSMGLKIEATPDDRIKLQAMYRDQDSSLLGAETARGANVEVRPNQTISMAAGISQRLTDDFDDVTKEARVQYQPNAKVALGGGMRLRDIGDDVSRVTDVSASIKPNDFISVSGGYTDRDMADPGLSMDTVALALAVNTTNNTKLIGSYQKNPEDQRTGQVLAANSKSIGLETRLGVLSVSGGYTRKDDLVLRTMSSEKKLGLGIDLSEHSRLTGSYRLADAFLGFESQSETFSLGYSRRLGSDFNLLLSGSMTRYEQEQLMLGRPDYQAEAKLGLKF